jgi:hypothetical protein
MADVTLDFNWILEAQMSVSGDTWRNSIGLSGNDGAGEAPPATTDTIITAFKNFMLGIHFPDTTLDKLTLRPAIQHRGPTPGVETPPVWELAVGSTGTGNTTFGGAHFSGFLPKDAAVFCKKATSGGRSGKMYLRNIITEADVQSNLDGRWTFADHAGGWQTSVFNALAVTDLGAYFTNPAGTGHWSFAVHHLMNVKATDTRVPYKTLMTGLTAVAPVWNTAHR